MNGLMKVVFPRTQRNACDARFHIDQHVCQGDTAGLVSLETPEEGKYLNS